MILATDVTMPAVGEVVTVRYTGQGGSGVRQQAVVRHVGILQTGRGTLPRIGLSLVAEETTGTVVDRRELARYPCRRRCRRSRPRPALRTSPAPAIKPMVCER